MIGSCTNACSCRITCPKFVAAWNTAGGWYGLAWRKYFLTADVSPLRHQALALTLLERGGATSASAQRTPRKCPSTAEQATATSRVRARELRPTISNDH
jgi:hypothetical protein